ncbi:MAG: CbiQ family ECF transporter T component, partial [Candidatus Omnitrophica bacterium]|nr:CbiQ family ECF transporter T component [Candidatus Omnitrophota bacterium]
MSRNSFIERSLQGAFSFLRESIFSEEYAAKAGFLQARDPRLKSLSVLFLLLAVLLTRNVSFLVAMYAFCLFLAYVSSINLGFFLRRTWIFIPLFSLVIVLPVLFDIFTPGDPLMNLRLFGFSLSVTRQGIASAVFFFMRVLTSVSLCILLVLTT